MSSLCNVTGTAVDPAEAGIAGAPIVFRRNGIGLSLGLVILPEVIEDTLGAAGEVDIDLLPGFYDVTIRTEALEHRFNINVPNAAAADISTLYAGRERPFGDIVLVDDASELPAPLIAGVWYGVRA